MRDSFVALCSALKANKASATDPGFTAVIKAGRCLAPCCLAPQGRGSGFRRDAEAPPPLVRQRGDLGLGGALLHRCTPGYVRLDTPLLLGAGFLTGGDGLTSVLSVVVIAAVL